MVLTDVPHAAVMAAWDRAMFGVMPSLWPEPFGATVAEAMNRGRPVIGTTLGGHVDMIGDTAGHARPAGRRRRAGGGDGEADRRPERCASSTAGSRAERAKDFAASAVIPRFEQAYRDVIAAGAPPDAEIFETLP